MIKKILIADTDWGTLNFLRDKLDANNLVVRTAHGGDQAIGFASHEEVNLLIAAIEMPHPHGVDLANAIRAKQPDLPVILISRNHAFDNNIQKLINTMKQTAFMTKPVRVSSLYKAIEHLLHAKISWTERRIGERIPMKIPVAFSFRDPKGGSRIIRAFTDNVSIGGLCFVQTPCNPCTGYIEGGVHDDCLFAPVGLECDAVVSATIFPDGREEQSIVLLGKIANTRIVNPGTLELIGVTFTESSKHEVDKLRAFLKSVVKAREKHHP